MHITARISDEALVSSGSPWLITVLGAILGTQNGRDVAVQNSFELVHFTDESGHVKIDEEFLATRREQCEF